MSKVLIKVTGITAIGISCLYLLIFATIHLVVPYDYLMSNIHGYAAVLMIACLSLVLVFGGMVFLHYKDLSDDELKGKAGFILAWSIVFLVTSGICGILGFAAYMFLYNGEFSYSKIGYIEELKELEKLNKCGLITDKEYEAKKKKILDI